MGQRLQVTNNQDILEIKLHQRIWSYMAVGGFDVASEIESGEVQLCIPKQI